MHKFFIIVLLVMGFSSNVWSDLAKISKADQNKTKKQNDEVQGVWGGNLDPEANKTEAAIVCTDPKCYGLPPDAGVKKIAELCRKTLPKHCQKKIPIEYTQCHPSKTQVVSDIADWGGIGDNEAVAIVSLGSGVEGCISSLVEAVTDTIELLGLGGNVLAKAADFAVDLMSPEPEIRAEALDATSLFLSHLHPKKIPGYASAVKKSGETWLQEEWEKISGCLNGAGRTKYTCKKLTFIAEAYLGGGVIKKGARLIPMDKIAKKLFKIRASKKQINIADIFTRKGKLDKMRRIRFNDLKRYKLVDNMDFSGLTNDMVRLNIRNQKEFFKKLPFNKLLNIDLKKAQKVLDYLPKRRLIKLLKETIRRGKELPDLSQSKKAYIIWHRIKGFNPKEISKLKGLGEVRKGFLGNRLRKRGILKLSQEQAKALTVQQARGIRKDIVKILERRISWSDRKHLEQMLHNLDDTIKGNFWKKGGSRPGGIFQ